MAKKTKPRKHVFRQPSEAEREEFLRVFELVRKELSELPAVIRVSRGMQLVNGYCTGRLSVQLEVRTDKDKAAIRKFANRLGIKRTYGLKKRGGRRFPSDILVTDNTMALGNGDGIVARKSGTLGVSVRLDSDGGSYWLTAAHVISDKQLPLTPSGPTTVKNKANRAIGSVAGNSFVYEYSDVVDCALIEGNTTFPVPVPIAGQNLKAIHEPFEGQFVVMKGDKSGVRHGQVVSVDPSATPVSDDGVTVTVRNHFKVIGYVPGQLSIKIPFADLGDSGAMVRLDDGTAGSTTAGSGTIIGLLRATNAAQNTAYVAKMHKAASNLGFR